MTVLYNLDKNQAVQTKVVNGKYIKVGKKLKVQMCELDTYKIDDSFYRVVTDSDNEIEEGWTLLEDIEVDGMTPYEEDSWRRQQAILRYLKGYRDGECIDYMSGDEWDGLQELIQELEEEMGV